MEHRAESPDPWWYKWNSGIQQGPDRSAHKGAKISSVYLQYETDNGWSKAIYATLEDSKATAFDGLDDEVFHEGKESRLHITYKLPRTVQVEYWKNIGTGYERMLSEGYGIGPDFVYAYDYISISETSTSRQDIIKAVPDSLQGYGLGKWYLRQELMRLQEKKRT